MFTPSGNVLVSIRVLKFHISIQQFIEMKALLLLFCFFLLYWQGFLERKDTKDTNSWPSPCMLTRWAGSAGSSHASDPWSSVRLASLHQCSALALGGLLPSGNAKKIVCYRDGRGAWEMIPDWRSEQRSDRECWTINTGASKIVFVIATGINSSSWNSCQLCCKKNRKSTAFDTHTHTHNALTNPS